MLLCYFSNPFLPEKQISRRSKLVIHILSGASTISMQVARTLDDYSTLFTLPAPEISWDTRIALITYIACTAYIRI